MNRVCLKCVLLLLCLVVLSSCTDLSGVESDIQNLSNRVTTLEDALSKLKKAYDEGKKITSVTPTLDNEGWVILFSDNESISVLNTSELLIKNIFEDKKNGVITMTLSDNTVYVFNLDLSYPTGINVLTEKLRIRKSGIVTFDVYINPSNAFIDTDNIDECFSINLINKSRGSYINSSQNYKISKIEVVKDDSGNLVEGLYRVTLKDLSFQSNYCENVTLVLTTKDGKGEVINISSNLFTVEWYNGDDFYDFKIGDIYGLFDLYTITVYLPKGTNVSSLSPTFITNGTVIVDGNIQISGVSTQNFSSSKYYKVKDKDGNENTYKVSVVLN